MCSFRDSSSLVTCMQASVEVAGTRIATTRCTLIVNQRFRARVRMANVPSDWFTYRFSGTENHSKKTYENRQWRGSAIFFSWHVVGSVSGDCYITRQHARSDLRCLRFPVIYSTRNIYKDRQLRHGGIRFHINLAAMFCLR